MKTLHKLFGITIVAMLSFIIVSCNNNDLSPIPGLMRLPTPIGNSWLEYPLEDLDEACFQLMCQQRTELTEIPRFIDEETLDSVITALNEMTEEEYCEWYQSQSNHNTILASHAYFDGLLVSTAETMGIDLDVLNATYASDNVALLSEAIIDSIEAGNSSLVTIVTTTSGKTIYRPIGKLDMAALADEDGQIIVGYQYYRYIGGYLWSMPLTVYMEIPLYTPSSGDAATGIRSFMNNLGLYEYNDDFGIAKLPQEVITSIADVSNSSPNPLSDYNATLTISPDQSDYKFMVYSQDEQYGSFIRLYAYEYHGWFHNRRDGICYVENYYFSPNTAKGVATKHVAVSIDAYFVTTGTIDTNRSWSCHFVEQHSYKTHTYRSRLQFAKSDPLDAPIVISGVQISFAWENTATVILEY